MMGQSVTEYPGFPVGVKIVAWLILLSGAAAVIFFAAAAITSPVGEVLFRWSGHNYLLRNWYDRLAGILAAVAVGGIGITLGVYVLKAHMWAYYIVLALLAANVADTVASHFSGQRSGIINDILDLAMLVLWVIGFKGCRRYAAFWRARTQPETRRARGSIQ